MVSLHESLFVTDTRWPITILKIPEFCQKKDIGIGIEKDFFDKALIFSMNGNFDIDFTGDSEGVSIGMESAQDGDLGKNMLD